MWGWLSVVLSGFISVAVIENSQKMYAAVFKTLSMLILMVILWSQNGLVGVSAWWMTLGLMLAILADNLHIFKKYHKFCFLAYIGAQLCYSTAFGLQLSGQMVWWLPVMLLSIGIVLFFFMLPKIDRVIFPVVIMGMTLLQLNGAAWAAWLFSITIAGGLGVLGALMLTVSAGLLAIHDYRRPIFFGHYIISASYLLAHCLMIASLSV